MGWLKDWIRGCAVDVLIDGLSIAVMDVWVCVCVGGVIGGWVG